MEGADARRFHQHPAAAAVADAAGALLTAVALVGAILGCSGCAGSQSPCVAWNGAKAAACAVCALPSCDVEVGGGEILDAPEPEPEPEP